MENNCVQANLIRKHADEKESKKLNWRCDCCLSFLKSSASGDKKGRNEKLR